MDGNSELTNIRRCLKNGNEIGSCFCEWSLIFHTNFLIDYTYIYIYQKVIKHLVVDSCGNSMKKTPVRVYKSSLEFLIFFKVSFSQNGYMKLGKHFILLFSNIEIPGWSNRMTFFTNRY